MLGQEPVVLGQRFNVGIGDRVVIAEAKDHGELFVAVACLAHFGKVGLFHQGHGRAVVGFEFVGGEPHRGFIHIVAFAPLDVDPMHVFKRRGRPFSIDAEIMSVAV